MIFGSYVAIVRKVPDIGYRSVEFRTQSEKGTIYGGPLLPMETTEVKPREVAEFLEKAGEHISLDLVHEVLVEDDDGVLRKRDLVHEGLSLRETLERELEWKKAGTGQWTRGLLPWRKPAEA